MSCIQSALRLNDDCNDDDDIAWRTTNEDVVVFAFHRQQDHKKRSKGNNLIKMLFILYYTSMRVSKANLIVRSMFLALFISMFFFLLFFPSIQWSFRLDCRFVWFLHLWLFNLRASVCQGVYSAWNGDVVKNIHAYRALEIKRWVFYIFDVRYDVSAKQQARARTSALTFFSVIIVHGFTSTIRSKVSLWIYFYMVAIKNYIK